MAGNRPLKYQIMDPSVKPEVRPRRPRPRGRSRKSQMCAPHNADLAKALRAARFRDGRQGRGEWSLRSVAATAGMSHTTLSQVENGKRRMVADDLVRLADVLGEDREELLVRAGYLPTNAVTESRRQPLTVVERRLIEQLRARPALLPAIMALLATTTEPSQTT